jgi:hypothetical protein
MMVLFINIYFDFSLAGGLVTVPVTQMGQPAA